MNALVIALAIFSAQIGLVVTLASVSAAVVSLPPAARLRYWRLVLASSLLLIVPATFGMPATVPVVLDVPGAVSLAVTGTSTALPWTLSSAIVFIWLTGMVARLGWLLVGLGALRRLRHSANASPATRVLGLMTGARSPDAPIRWHPGVTHPVSFGLYRPLILLPPYVRTLPAESQAAIVHHEQLHVTRRDWPWHIAEEVLLAVWWFHPAIWWVVDRLRLNREQTIDELVVTHSQQRRGYMETLLRLADEPRPAVVTSSFGGRRHLLSRMRALSSRTEWQPRRVLGAKLALGFVLLVSVSAACTLAVQDRIYGPDDASITLPSATTSPSPQYTAAALEMGLEGVVRLTGVVRSDGTVSDIQIVESLDATYGLDDQARATLTEWRFEPGRRNGTPVPVQVDFEFRFLPR